MTEISQRPGIFAAIFVVVCIVSTIFLGDKLRHFFESYSLGRNAVEALVLICLHLFGYLFLTPLRRMGIFRFLKLAIVNSLVLFGLSEGVDYLFSA